MILAILLACNATEGMAKGTESTTADSRVHVPQPPYPSPSVSSVVEPTFHDSPPEQRACYHPRYVTRKGAKVLLLLVETPGLYAMVPAKKDEINSVIYTTGDLGYAPEMAPVYPGEILRVYRCNGDAWGYLGDLNISGFNSEGGRVTSLTTPKLGGRTNQVPWVAEGPLIQPKRK